MPSYKDDRDRWQIDESDNPSNGWRTPDIEEDPGCEICAKADVLVCHIRVHADDDPMGDFYGRNE